ncbi:TPA: DEAD/DEAH box helicase [Pseudomonas aeruginosa]|uniref:DEAD/DEAH box helicase n=1 Tax=Pseudomonas aeruginosa TaxID=287 RepID=UPI00053EE859|nr:DEAD/DEAH box helicase [Pseudomonas aeruginosa]MDA3201415.1 DEAD/DEAH box helicase [Pseudomonas aeruginosa]MDA3382191.1 DEAD/DEAH box helicase [Pseudomonas aeruginosa]HBO3248580.1 DEAD/DEAH box helicase [Pseudomonas aeruginosa]HCF1815446.1 DEAD/DEAH box helicase [Pseudomonas aeruginosa]HCF4451838.1 DEAD/DEAH box helicase [Pseudomonas aeruginosa]
METIDELTAFLTTATVDGILGRLLYRGAAWSLMRDEGVLPPNAPPLGATIETDLAEHGFALLRGAMALRAQAGASELTSKAFERAANAFEALVRNGDPEAPDRGFRRTIAAAAYHLAGFSAVAYSLFNETAGDLNTSPGETAIRHLILRDLDQLRGFVREWLGDAAHGDEQIAEALRGEDPDVDEVLSTILNTTICRALAFFDFALETGEPEPIESARALLATAVSLAGNAENVPLWWISNLCHHLIDDLWQHSLHQNLPTEPPEGTEEKYPDLRRLFISSLYARKTSEVELWPSQREAAQRSTDVRDDLVVALPTSAGKTRVAEIATLMTLSSVRRVLIVTPLRALSAQTERSFRKTFAPLGFSVSSLYGASGLSAGDEDALRTREIIIATPEKLDFALRSDPSLIDDVGLIVLDEGHMIGPSEREIRYETLVQRLLRRADAAERRIVCLSAILPSGDELDDLTAWIRSDEPGEPVRSDWRPTRQRFGALTWRGKDALLRLDLDDDGPFLDKFVVEKPALGRETKPYPRKNSHLVLFAAWEFASQGKRTLIFSTQANWVESYGKQVVDLCKRGYLDPLLDDEASIARALEVGKEWLGEDHPAVASLKAGVAIHHGRLPSPFLRELEILLSEGVLKVIVASPTLSQGLNLNAAVLLVPALYRAGEKIKGEEFANVAGRAGRAFVDVEGLIVHIMFDQIDWRKREWRRLVASAKARTLKSGLIQIVTEILERLAREGVLDRADAWEYLANAREAWRSPDEEVQVADRLAAAVEYDADADEDDEEEPIDEEPLSQLVERLDATVFGLIEALDADRADLPKLLDEALKGSLWARQIAREGEDVAPLHKKVFEARADLIWKTTTAQARRGHFAMGVGLEAGLTIDAMADELAELLDRADEAALSGDIDELVDALCGLGERLLFMRPFIPDKANALPANWKAILRSWVSGEEVSKIGPQNMRAVEEAFTYRLVWALEAVRTRRMSLGWSPETVAGGAAAAVETGVPRFMMAMLIRAGLPSRRAAMVAIEDAEPVFVTPAEMRAWLESDEITAYTDAGDWPTPDTAALWARFRTEALNDGIQKWSVERYKRLLDIEAAPPAGLYRIVTDEGDGRTWLATPDYQRVAAFKKPAVDPKPSLFSGRLPGETRLVEALRVGRGKLRWPPADA